jgi:hypothetical protein
MRPADPNSRLKELLGAFGCCLEDIAPSDIPLFGKRLGEIIAQAAIRHCGTGGTLEAAPLDTQGTDPPRLLRR